MKHTHRHHEHPQTHPQDSGDTGHPRGQHRGQHRRRGPFDYGDLRLLLLHMIEGQPRHGYELIKAIEDRSEGRYVPSPGVIYPTLAWLDDMGFVDALADAGRKSHSITDAGRAFLAANRAQADALWARDWQQEPDDPVRDGMGAIKRALRARLADDAATEETRAAIVTALHAAARAIDAA